MENGSDEGYLSTIAIIVCYYGSFPWYFDYFLLTCRHNPTITFYLITDQEVGLEKIAANVRPIYRQIEELEQSFSEKLGLKVTLTQANAYKLSEFKHAYGYLFSDLLVDYAFWGQCDIDLVFGNIRHFFTNEILAGYDIFSVRPDWIPGCFFLYKNTSKNNLLFFESKDYQFVFSSEIYYNFDETNFRHNEFKSGKAYNEVSSSIESMLHVIQRMQQQRVINVLFDFFMIEGLPGKIKWTDGILTYRNRYEILLFHMMYLKNIYKPKAPPFTSLSSFSIGTARIYNYL